MAATSTPQAHDHLSPDNIEKGAAKKSIRVDRYDQPRKNGGVRLVCPTAPPEKTKNLKATNRANPEITPTDRRKRKDKGGRRA
jgi:hypothetical protein